MRTAMTDEPPVAWLPEHRRRLTRLSRSRSRPGGLDRLDADTGVEQLFRSHRLGMVRLAVLLVDDRETAEDVTQDAFTSLHRRWDSLDSQDAAVAYLRTCVINAARSILRRRRTVRQNPQPDTARATVDGADAPALLAEEHRAVLTAIRSLPDRQREVIMLRYWSELTEREIAAILGISVGGVKSSASRGRSAIASQLGGGR
jgi:RNA polymerase sigma-70 factor (sigma-E family)